MAYASLLSLDHTLEQILHPDNQSLLLHHQTEQQLMRLLHEKVGFLLAFLDVISPKSSEKIIGFEKRIREAAYEAEDLIESQIYSKQILRESHVSNYQKLQNVKEELGTILEDLLQMKESNLIEIQQPSNCLSAPSSKSGSDVFVGFLDQLDQVQNLLVVWPPKLEIISIVGVPELGKITLARKIYNDSDIVAHFDIRSWVTVPPEFRELEVLEHILSSIGDLNHESRKQSVDKLSKTLYRRLKHKRFLIVMDDVRDASVVEQVKRLLPEDNNGSRILLTTRHESIARDANPYIEPYKLRFLTDEDCWKRLHGMVFGSECCPDKLIDLGKSIARLCSGIPLAIVLTGGFLCKAERTTEYWTYVKTNMHALILGSFRGSFPIWAILSFCYNHLPHHLRACFLYMGILPNDYAIRRSQLINLWVANRFIKPNKSKNLEDVAEAYLQDLVERNLITVCEWTYSGEIKTCCVHDLVWDFCVMKAKEEKVDSESEHLPETLNILRHVSILTDKIPKVAHSHDFRVRSVTFLSRNSLSDIHSFTSFQLLRILDAFTLSLDEFPLELIEIITLRYIALTFWLKHSIPASISKLCNLETLIINPGKLRSMFNASFLPLEIWKLSRLRHLFFVRGFLPYPTEALNGASNVLFENLQTLNNIINLRWTKEVLQMMPNLKKLVISYEHDGRTEWSSYCFDNFVLLHKLEVLKCFFFEKAYMKYEEPMPVKFTFPQKLRRLTLSGCRISWKDMTIVGSLSSLQVLKLKFHAFEGLVWEPNDGEFCQLKLLLIHMSDLEHWKAIDTHFPSLERLTLNYCYNLVEIPSGIGKIPTLQKINLCGCSTLVVASAEVIQEEQKKFGNNEFKVMLKKDEDDANIFS